MLPVLLRNLLPVLQLVLIGVLVAEVAGPMLVVSGVGVAIGRLLEGRQLRSMHRVMLREGVCPSCAYSLRELEAGEEGVTTCSECGGAWVLPSAPEPAPEPREQVMMAAAVA